jgi:hypothetical protein
MASLQLLLIAAVLLPLLLAMLVNTAVKAVLAAALGGLPMLRSATAVLAVALAGGLVTAVVTLG